MTQPPWGCMTFEVFGTCVPSTALVVMFSLACFAWIAWRTYERGSA